MNKSDTENNLDNETKGFWQKLEVLDRQHWISESFQGKGDIDFKGTFRISGEWTGVIRGEVGDSHLHLLKSGILKGRVHVSKVQIEGRCECEELRCDLLHVAQGAFLSGNIFAKRMIIDPGSVVEATFQSER